MLRHQQEDLVMRQITAHISLVKRHVTTFPQLNLVERRAPQLEVEKFLQVERRQDVC